MIVDKSDEIAPLTATPVFVTPVNVWLLMTVPVRNELDAVPSVWTTKPPALPPDSTWMAIRPLLLVEVYTPQ